MEETKQMLELGGKDSREVREADVAEDHRSLGVSYGAGRLVTATW